MDNNFKKDKKAGIYGIITLLAALLFSTIFGAYGSDRDIKLRNRKSNSKVEITNE